MCEALDTRLFFFLLVHSIALHSSRRVSSSREPFMPAFGLKIYYFSFSMFVPNSFWAKTRFLFISRLAFPFHAAEGNSRRSLSFSQSAVERATRQEELKSGEKATNNNTDWNFCAVP